MKKLILILPIILAGCSIMGTNPKPPSKLEEAIFRVETNVVPFVVLQTNLIPVNISVPAYKTNEIGIVVTNTTAVTKYETNVVLVTNLIPTYTYAPSDRSREIAGGIGAVTNIAAPGLGTTVTAGLLALLAAWGHLRGSKFRGASNTLAQEVETIREFIKTLPSGAKYDVAITRFLQSHQVEEGTAKQILEIVESQVDNPEAKTAVAEIRATLGVLTGPA